MNDITWIGTITLALADSVNPCALAVLFMILVSIMMYNPKKKSKILLSGLAFVASVFIMYFFYGAIIITLLTKLSQTLASWSLYVYKFFGLFAIILGVLSIKDFISYKPGTLGTEMPLMLRPKVKKIISKVTSPKGAFTTGIFVTLFLLPCTIGPYIVFGNLISQSITTSLSEKITLITQIAPYLLVYNLIFILPMLVVTFLVYFGITTINKAQNWKEENIRILHLIAGIILLVLGLAMISGLL